jgi:hypothetical protein
MILFYDGGGGGIRTHEPLKDGISHFKILSPARLTRLRDSSMFRNTELQLLFLFLLLISFFYIFISLEK